MLNLSHQTVHPNVRSNHTLRSLDALETPPAARRLTRWLLLLLGLGVLVLFLPWQQNVSGYGTLTALTPQDRPQEVQNIIAGRIERWYVKEGDQVHKGDTLLALSEIKDEYFDPNLPQRLREQVQGKSDAISGYNQKVVALDNTITALQQGLVFSLQKARNKVQQAEAKVKADSADFVNERQQFVIAQAQYARYEQGQRDGLFSLTDLENRRQRLQASRAKVVSAENYLAVARQELVNARIELASIRADYEKEIAKARSDRSSALSAVADGEVELSKLRNKAASVDVRRAQYILRAPQDGYVVRALKAGLGETIKEGESVVTLQPESPGRAVELYVNAMDLPLIQRGKPVRVRFDGWPVLQFSGWPQVSVGTFGGTVTVVDRVATPDGKYRILVTPNNNSDEPWPDQLRLGQGVYGWVMLSNVRVWYEIWRRINGFPPDLVQSPGTVGKGKEAKK
jgi:multidrug resistance efflux pump